MAINAIPSKPPAKGRPATPWGRMAAVLFFGVLAAALPVLIWPGAVRRNAAVSPQATAVTEPAPAPAPAGRRPDMVSYFQFVGRQTTEMNGALGRLGDILTGVAARPSLIRDRDWPAKTDPTFNDLRRVGRAYQSYGTIPDDLRPLRDTLVSLGADLVAVADLYQAGLAADSAPQLKAASDRLMQVNAKQERANRQLQTLVRELGG